MRMKTILYIFASGNFDFPLGYDERSCSFLLLWKFNLPWYFLFLQFIGIAERAG